MTAVFRVDGAWLFVLFCLHFLSSTNGQFDLYGPDFFKDPEPTDPPPTTPSDNRSFNLDNLFPTAVKGEPGPTGPKGERGEKGSTGEPGRHGRKGAIGLQGEKGDRGRPGELGKKGERGFPGFPAKKGAIGPHGPSGSPGVSVQGPKGRKGERGPWGPSGEPGVRGDRGRDGRDGRHGRAGQKGALGKKGGKGERGDVTFLQGPIGKQGEKGNRGRDGRQGATGAEGEKGNEGARGSPGHRGYKGQQGTTGLPGPPGETAPEVLAPPQPPIFSDQEVTQIKEMLSIPWSAGRAAGPPGPPGPQGPQGKPGSKGDIGTPFLATSASQLPNEAIINELYRSWAALQQQISWLNNILVAGLIRARPARTCRDVLRSGIRQSGVYWIDPSGSGDPGNAILVHCDLDTDGGGWALVYRYTFTRTDSFMSPDNDVIPVPTWPVRLQPRTPRSRAAPSSELGLGALDFTRWSLLGREFLLKSNLGDWVACREDNGSLVSVKSGRIQCRIVRSALRNCETVVPGYLDWSLSMGPVLQVDHGGRTLYRWEALRHYVPNHNGCSLHTNFRFISRVVVPYGSVFIR